MEFGWTPRGLQETISEYMNMLLGSKQDTKTMEDLCPADKVGESALEKPDQTLSSRGRRVLKPNGEAAQHMIDKFGQLWAEAKLDIYNSESNPNGYVITMTAENKLSYDVIDDTIRQACLEVPASSAGYDVYHGILRFRKAIAQFYENHIFTDDVIVDPEHFIVSAGVASIVDSIFYNLVDDGEGVLVPTPCYTSHERNMSIRSRAILIPVPVNEENNFVVTPTLLSDAAVIACVQGSCTRVKAILLTNPVNPTGTMYSYDELKAIISWCVENSVHLVADEVYAVSIFGKQSFVSVSQVARSMQKVDMNFVHAIWGLSKDFCMSGNRCGILYTTNVSLLNALKEMSVSNGCAIFFQHALSTLFEDKTLIATYVKENQRRLRESYILLSEGLREIGIPFVEAQGGLFVWMSLTSILGEGSSSSELYHSLVRKHKILLTPASMCRGDAGWFRCCFASVSQSTLEELLRRLSHLKNSTISL